MTKPITTQERIAFLKEAYAHGCRTEAIGEELFDIIQRLRDELARRDAVRVEVPLDGHDQALLDAVQCYKDDPIRGVVEWSAINRTVAYIRAHLVPAPPQAATGLVFELDGAEAMHLAWEKHYNPLTCNPDMFTAGREAMLGAVREILARRSLAPQADAVVVPREEQLLREVGELTLVIRSAEEVGIPNTRAYVEANDKRHKLLDDLNALRTSAQDHNGEGAT